MTMKDLLKSDIKKNFTGLGFWAFAICTAFLSVVFAGIDYYGITGDEDIGDIVYILYAAIICFFVVCYNVTAAISQLRDGIIKNKIISGKSRAGIFTSLQLTFLLGDMILVGISLGLDKLAVIIAGKGKKVPESVWLSSENIIRIILAVFMLGIISTSIGLVFNERFSLVTAVSLLLILTYMSSYVKNRIFNDDTLLKQKTKYEVFVDEEENGKEYETKYSKVENPDYIGKDRLSVYKYVHHLDPVSHFRTVYDYVEINRIAEEEYKEYNINFETLLDSDKDEAYNAKKKNLAKDYDMLPLYCIIDMMLYFGISVFVFKKKNIN